MLPEQDDSEGRLPEYAYSSLRRWEGDWIKGAFNRSVVSTLVERSSRLVLLAYKAPPPRWKGSVGC